MNELYLIKSGDNGFVEETSAVISADSGEISINDSLYVESAGNIGIGSSNPVNKLDVVGSASISSDLTVQGITFTNVGGNSPSAANDIIMYNGSDWVVAAASQLPGGGGGAGNSAVPAGLINTLTQGDAIHEVTFGYDASGARIVYDNVPKIAASLEIDGAGEIIPHTVSGVSESGYFVVFSEELPTANYRMHTVFGGTDAFWETGVANLEYSDRNVEVTRSLYVGQKVGIGTTNPGASLHVNGNDFILGGGHLSSSPQNCLIIAPYGEGDNIGGGDLNVYAGRSTGTGVGGDITFLTSPAGVSSGDGVNAHISRLKITSGGNVGIGTTNPVSKLQVNGVARVVDGDVYLTSITEADKEILFLRRSDGGEAKIRVENFGGTSNSLYNAGFKFQTTNYDGSAITTSTKLSIAANGNVGIGITNPSKKLTIFDQISGSPTEDQSYGEIGFGSRPDGTVGASIKALAGDNSNGTDGKIQFLTASNTVGGGPLAPRMTIDSDGNVGIGTTNPISIAKVDINYTASSQVALNLKGDNTALNNAIRLVDASDNVIQLSINAGNFGINGGNVGIGATNPSQGRLVTTGYGGHSNTRSFVAIAHNNNVESYFRIARMGSGDSTSVSLANNYNRDVPAYQADDNTAGISDITFRDDGGLSFSTGAVGATQPVEKMRIDTSGNVGIGTASVRYGSKLDVNGPLFVQGVVKLDNLIASADVRTDAAKQLFGSSDVRLKNDLGDCEYGLNEILQVQPKRYTWKGGPEDQQPTVGFFSQEVHSIMPEAAPREAIYDQDNNPALDQNGEQDYKWGLNSQTIIAALVNATKEQQTMIEDLKKEIEQLKS